MTSDKPAIVTIGNFDGVHVGHQKLIQEVTARADSLGVCSLAITFDPHPEQVLFPERRITYLSSPQERLEILKANGVDDVWVCPFTTALARLEPVEFMRMVAERRPLAELWVGADFALGHGRRGTISVLSEIGGAYGWGLHVVPPYRLAGQIVSSTAIRTLLGAGAVRGAADLLGRPYSVRGYVQADRLVIDPLRAVPRQGRYAAHLTAAEFSGEILADIGSSPGEIRLTSIPGGSPEPPSAPRTSAPADSSETQASSPAVSGREATLTFLRRVD